MAISMKSAYEPVEVDLWAEEGGALFETVDLTRSAQLEGEEVLRKLEGVESSDAQVEVLAGVLDIRLKAVGTKKVKPSALILKRWKSDELTIGQLFGLLTQLGEATNPTQTA